MAPRWIIVDGYSLLYRLAPDQRAPRGDTERHRLIVWLSKTAPLLAERVTIVFDGRGHQADTPYEPNPVEVVYSPSHQTADTVIERMVCSAPHPNEIMVVTSDLAERHTVEAAGAMTMGCGDFLEECRRAEDQLTRSLNTHKNNHRGATLGDFFPKSG